MAAPAQDDGRVAFNNLSLGLYTVEVTAPGYAVKREEVALDAPGAMDVLIYMRLEGKENTATAAPGGPTLAPKAQKEIQSGLAALRENKLDEAREKFERAVKLAPGHPYPHYLLGVLYRRKTDFERAKKELLTSTGLDPRNGVAQLALGDLLLRQGDAATAIPALEQAIANGSGTWETHWMLAGAYFDSRQYEKALAGADKAVALANGRGAELGLLRAQALMALDRKADAAAALTKFLAENPAHPRAEMARSWLNRLHDSMTPAPASPPSTSDAPRPAVAEPAPAPPPHVEVPEPAWAPADVESAAPPFEPGTTCNLESVLTGAEKRAVLLADNLDRIAATEHVQIVELDSAGGIRAEQEQVYEFMASVRESKGNLFLDESRDLRSKTADWQVRWLTSGLAELGFVFHPYYVKDFALRCEGLTRWRGEPAWAIHFQQREDRPVRFRSYGIGAETFPVKLKGRALIGANNHQLVRIETDLMEPVKQLPLEREHLVINYAPVDFKQRSTVLWLPQNAELFLHIRGRRYHFSHQLSGFSLFSVDMQQQIKEPPKP